MIITSPNDDLKKLNSKLKNIKQSAEWESWEIVVFIPDNRARYDEKGVFKNGSYGFERRIAPNKDGVWLV